MCTDTLMRLAITKRLGFVHVFAKEFWRYKRGVQWYLEA